MRLYILPTLLLSFFPFSLTLERKMEHARAVDYFEPELLLRDDEIQRLRKYVMELEVENRYAKGTPMVLDRDMETQLRKMIRGLEDQLEAA